MPVQAVSNRDNLSDTLTMGVGGAGIGIGVGYLLKPSVNTYTKTAQQIAVQNTSNDICVLTNAIKEAKTNGFKKLSKGTTSSIVEIGKFRNIKEMQVALGNLVEEKTLFQGGKIYETALKKLTKTKNNNSELINNAKNVLSVKLEAAKDFISTFNDGMISFLKSTATYKEKAVANDIMHQAKYSNAVKGGAIGAAIAITLYTLGLMMKPKQKYVIIQEEKRA